MLDSLSQLWNMEFMLNSFSLRSALVTHKHKLSYSRDQWLQNEMFLNQFLYIVRGSISFDNLSFPCKQGSILYFPYNSTYKAQWHIDDYGEFISLDFTLKDTNNKFISLSNNVQLVKYDESLDYLKDFLELKDTWYTGALGFRLKCRSLFYNIVYKLSVNAGKQHFKKSYKPIYNSVLYLENNYIEDVSTSKLAEMSCLSECTFRRLFKELTGVTPVQYRNNLRIKKAAEMLKSGEFKVVEAMVATGFNDPSYFNKLFNKYTGTNPSEFMLNKK